MPTALELLKQKNAQSGSSTGSSAFDALKQKSIVTPTVEQPKQEGLLKSLIKAPIKSLLVKPAARVAEALGSLGVFGKDIKTGYELMQDEGGQKLDIPLLGKYNVEAVKPGMAGAKQVAGEALEAGSWLVGGGGGAGVAKGAVKGLVKKAVKTTFGTAIKTGAKIGAEAGAMGGAGVALQEDKGAMDIAKQTALGGIGGAALGGALGGATELAIKGISKTAGAFANRATQKAEQKALLKSGEPSSLIAGKKLAGEKIVKDLPAREAIKQGIPEADVALIKTSSLPDKTKMSKMLDIREKQLTNKRVVDRATDVVGETFTKNVAGPIEKLNKDAGKKLNVIAQRLSGHQVDPTPAITNLRVKLESAGITFTKKGKLNFKNSNFEGLGGAQNLITNVWNRALKVAKSGDALQMHRAKSYIDEIVNYGKQAKRLSGKVQGILKSFRHDIDTILDTKFPVYNKVNTQFADTIQQLDNMGAAIGRKFKLGETFSDAQSGLAMRRILSNTKSRAEILKMLDGMQKVAKKYGIKIDEDIITQANFADVLENTLGSEAPTSFLGQGQRFKQTGVLDEGVSLMREATKWSPISASIRAAEMAVQATRGINQKNKIKALKALLQEGFEKPKTVFGKPPVVPTIPKGKGEIPITIKPFESKVYRGIIFGKEDESLGKFLTTDKSKAKFYQDFKSQKTGKVGEVIQSKVKFEKPLRLPINDGLFEKASNQIPEIKPLVEKLSKIEMSDIEVDNTIVAIEKKISEVAKKQGYDGIVFGNGETIIDLRKSTLGKQPPQQMFGAFAGIETEKDKEGKTHIKFSPEKAILGVAGMTALRSKLGQKISAPIFKGFKDLTTKVLEHLKGKTEVSKQFISDLTNMPELKQKEKDIIRNVLESQKGDKIPVQEFANKVKSELLPLKRLKNIDAKYESISLPDELRGNVANYSEHIYNSPIKTSAGEVHFGLARNGQETAQNYFGHTRIEDMADYSYTKNYKNYLTKEGTLDFEKVDKIPSSTRRVIEVQSDLYQKGRLADMGGTQSFNNTKDFKKGELSKLQQYNDPTAHFRMVREEVKQAAIDGKTKLQFPTGETAMKIEGLGGRPHEWSTATDNLTIDNLKIGESVHRTGDFTNDWIITDVLGDGKFKAVPKKQWDDWSKLNPGIKMGTYYREKGMNTFGEIPRLEQLEIQNQQLENFTEQFDISVKVDTNNPIYKFYEKDLGRYLKNKYNATNIVDDNGVSWMEVPIKKEMGNAPIEAFGLTPLAFTPLAFTPKKKEEK